MRNPVDAGSFCSQGWVESGRGHLVCHYWAPLPKDNSSLLGSLHTGTPVVTRGLAVHRKWGGPPSETQACLSSGGNTTTTSQDCCTRYINFFTPHTDVLWMLIKLFFLFLLSLEVVPTWIEASKLSVRKCLGSVICTYFHINLSLHIYLSFIYFMFIYHLVIFIFIYHFFPKGEA